MSATPVMRTETVVERWIQESLPAAKNHSGSISVKGDLGFQYSSPVARKVISARGEIAVLLKTDWKVGPRAGWFNGAQRLIKCLHVPVVENCSC
jgi:hypothetical protein